MINMLFPSFFGLYYLQKKIKLDVSSYVFYYALINLFTNTITAISFKLVKIEIELFTNFSLKYSLLASIISIVFSFILVLLIKNFKIKFIKEGDK